MPLNPLGQNINDQSYPFELIKNKTLQFLARALPVLKLEYETIPKVARYLPGQHLLNPTHLSSPLGHEHFYRLNQRLAGAQLLPPPSVNPFLVMSASGAGRRRRKRAVAEASYRVEDRLPAESSILFKSAHGRIRDYGNHNQTAAVDSSSSSQRVITKDGYRPISSVPQPTVGAKPALAVGQTAPPKSSVVVASNNTSHGNKQSSLTLASASASASVQNKVGGLENRQHQQQLAAGSTPASQPNAPSAGNSQQQQQRDHAKATTAASGQGAPSATTSSTPAPSTTTTTSTTPRSPTKQQAAAKEQAGTTSAASTRDQTSSSGLSKRRSLMGCSDSSNGFSSA